MIIRFPDMPPVEGPLSLPTPTVFLLGSYDPDYGAVGGWYEEAARYLDRYVGAVFYGEVVGEFREDFITWYFHWLNQCDLAVIWLDHPRNARIAWSQFEVGYIMSAYAWTNKPKVMMGVAPGNENLRRSIEIVAVQLDLDLRIHEDLPIMLHAARDVARESRLRVDT